MEASPPEVVPRTLPLTFRKRAYQSVAVPTSAASRVSSGSRDDSSQKMRCGLSGSALV